MRVSYVRPCPADNPLAYRLAILLHVSFVRDAELRDVNLTTMSRSAVKEHILGLERSTGLNAGILAFDAQLESDTND